MFDRYEGARLSEVLRAEFGKDNLSPVDVFEFARSVPRLTTVLYPLGKNISGMCITQSKFSLIAVNSGQTYGRQNFTLAHELYHLYYDKQKSASICPKDPSKFDDVERTADSFASSFILPYLALRNEIKNRGLLDAKVEKTDDRLLQSIIEIEQKYGMSRSALLVRLQDEGVVTAQQKADLSSNIKINARRLGFSTALYEPRRGNDEKKTEGEYVDLITLLFSKQAISQGKAEELLSEGFREDIWIESLEDGEIID